MNDDRDRLIVPDKTWFTVFSETSSVQCMVIVVNSLSSRDGHLCKIVFFLVLWNPSVAINCAFIKVSIWKVIKYIMPFPVLKQGHVKIHTPYPLYVKRLVYIHNILKKGNGQICIFFHLNSRVTEYFRKTHFSPFWNTAAAFSRTFPSVRRARIRSSLMFLQKKWY